MANGSKGKNFGKVLVREIATGKVVEKGRNIDECKYIKLFDIDTLAHYVGLTKEQVLARYANIVRGGEEGLRKNPEDRLVANTVEIMVYKECEFSPVIETLDKNGVVVAKKTGAEYAREYLAGGAPEWNNSRVQTMARFGESYKGYTYRFIER